MKEFSDHTFRLLGCQRHQGPIMYCHSTRLSCLTMKENEQFSFNWTGPAALIAPDSALVGFGPCSGGVWTSGVIFPIICYRCSFWTHSRRSVSPRTCPHGSPNGQDHKLPVRMFDMPQRVYGQGTSKPASVETCNQSGACATTHRPPCLHWRSSVMRVASRQRDMVAPAGSSVRPRVSRHAAAVLLQLSMAALCIVNAPSGSQAAEATQMQPPMEARVRTLIPDL